MRVAKDPDDLEGPPLMRGAFVVSAETASATQRRALLSRPPHTARDPTELGQHVLTLHQSLQTLLVPDPRLTERVTHRSLLAAVVPRVRLLEHEDRALLIRHHHSMRRPTDTGAATTYP